MGTFWDPIGALLGSDRDGIVKWKNQEKTGPTFLFCSIWQLVKNWLDRNDWKHILHLYSPRVWTIPSDKIAKSWKSMIFEIFIKTWVRVEMSDVSWRNIKINIRAILIQNSLERLMPWISFSYIPIEGFSKLSNPFFPKRGYFNFWAGLDL